MLFIKKKNKKQSKKKVKSQKFNKMYIYFIICNYGYSENITKILKENGSNAQVVCLGQGTAKKEVMNTLGLGSSSKNIVIAFVDETNINDIKKALSKYFDESKRVMGMGFSIPVTSIVGEKVYHFLTNSL